MHKADSGARRVLSIVAHKWTAPVVHQLASGSKRPSELMHSIEGISQKVLTQALRRMEQRGLVSRKVHAAVPPRVDYALTPLGLTLVEPVEIIRRWVKEHRAAIEAWEAQRKPAPATFKGERKLIKSKNLGS